MPGIKVPLPIIIGSDIAGEIAEIGAGVNGFAIGERVLIDPMPLPGEGAPKIVATPSRRWRRTSVGPGTSAARPRRCTPRSGAPATTAGPRA